MSRWREVIEYEGNNSMYLPPFPLFGYEIEDQLDFVFFDDLVSRKPSSYTIITDQILTTPPSYSHSHHHPSLYPRSTRFLLHSAPSLLDDLSDRLSFLESRFDRVNLGDRKNYTLTAEIKGDPERKYKWVTEIKPGSDKNKKKNGVKKWVVEDEEDDDEEEDDDDDDEEAEVRKYKWSAEIEGSGGRVGSRKYTIEVHTQTGTDFNKKIEEDENKKKQKQKKKVVVVEKKKNKRNNTGTRIVEIEDPNHGALVLRQV